MHCLRYLSSHCLLSATISFCQSPFTFFVHLHVYLFESTVAKLRCPSRPDVRQGKEIVVNVATTQAVQHDLALLAQLAPAFDSVVTTQRALSLSPNAFTHTSAENQGLYLIIMNCFSFCACV